MVAGREKSDGFKSLWGLDLEFGEFAGYGAERGNRHRGRRAGPGIPVLVKDFAVPG